MIRDALDRRFLFSLLIGALWCLGLGLALSHNRVLSLSGDIAFHTQVTDFVRHVFIVPADAEAWMPEMYPYPKVSHRLAAFAMAFGLPVLSAVVLVGTVSTAIVWLLLLDQARRVSLPALIVATGLTLANIAVTRATFGVEIISNFFYPQIVAEAVCVICLVIGGFLLTRSRPAFIAWAVASVVLVAFFHLVPTLKIAGAYMALLAVEWLRRLWTERRLGWLEPVGLVAISVAVVGNPFFWTMRRLSANNGSANFVAPLPLWQLGVAATVLAAICAWLLLAEARRAEPVARPHRAATLLAALGAATAAALLLQLLLLTAGGEGSEYAVRKHAPGVFAMLGLMVPVALFGGRGEGRPKRDVLGLVLLIAAHVLVMLALFLRTSVMNVPRVEHLLADSRQLREEQGLGGLGVAFASGGELPVVSFISTLAMLRSPIQGEVLSILFSGHPIHPEELKAIITPVGDVYDRAECRKGPPVGSVVAVDPACAALTRISFKAGQPGGAYLTQGWSAPEGGGAWSEQKRAVITLPISPAERRMEAAWLQISAFAFLPDQHPEQRVTVTVKGAAPQTFVFSKAHALNNTFVIALGKEALAADTLQVVFDIPDAMSPQALGMGPDPRLLGVGVEHAQILPRGFGR